MTTGNPPSDGARIDAALVRRLIAAQFPRWADLPVRPVEVDGWDNRTFHLGPRAGRASVATRMRLATAQKIVAVAELSDGTFWSDSADVLVTLAACLEDT